MTAAETKPLTKCLLCGHPHWKHLSGSCRAEYVAERAGYCGCSHFTAAADSRDTEGRGIYIASRTRHAEKWRALRDEGCPIISSWINEAGIGQTLDWRDLWDRCIAEASKASALIVYAEQTDAYLKGALAEVGAALSHGVPCYFVLADITLAGSTRNHRLVTECESLDDALALALAASVPEGTKR